ncbi:Cytochrome c oxidase assembly protein cox11, mitochondrial [Elasticomyces elasticus]|nr:Cytochrome c oxidase assembly protein cox11, mitochondrial [Elasticomyces elasticus]KAK3640869.1 Cytochrome c oxidase assembly protein cox11, mitochondrial [Elasticomyces elasticus]KAK4920329.1 Cytochrome c oxidase assembly protein cox11, mitochondrial [Elasticomyces elasticus]KAK5759058.1 Cytochrome c oxidase assembly protein cox11, mitochondrial [Elasticomyces elasticus]
MPPPRYRSLQELALKRPWTCPSCNRQPTRRRLQTSAKPRQTASPTQDALRKPFEQRNANTLYYTLSTILGTLALAYGSVPLYKTICQQTGWGGAPIKSAVHGGELEYGDPESIAAKLTPITTSRRLRITFAGSTSDILPWKFSPQQREVRVLPGETALAFYTATNNSPTEDIIGVATYSVTPAQVAPYFSKIQCFCFEEQRLNKGETVDMPVFFYIDPEFLKDPNMKGIDSITLNYTFFKAKYDGNGRLAPMPMPY